MNEQPDLKLSRRERQIMDIIYARERATATEVLMDLPDPPTRTAVRTLLRILEDKGHLKHTKKGREFVYQPTRPRSRAGRSALRRLLETFFEGSIEKAVAVHLMDPAAELSDEELDRLGKLIREAKRKGD
ncbi:MAG: BlaI/MecI/CopY family transcriptional regulator [Phycisphaerae bacterium]|nr:BlaI/MecI/CopY family transcriptional regulator [Phycisphaerae bacterium]